VDAVRRGVAIDHFIPVVARPDLAVEYDNLLYACATCNLSKGDARTPDPLAVLTDPAVCVAADGVIHSATPEAARLIELLGLDRDRMTEFRELWIGIVRLAECYDPGLFRRLTGFPDDLPDLSALTPPGGNTRPDGVQESYFARHLAQSP
jgi:hypothetical protein